jgi:divalent metal cation (Fe/Co/Zn/Cd) transporter
MREAGPLTVDHGGVNLRRPALWLEYATIGWNLLEAVVAVWAGIATNSIALVAFGLDSLIEVFAAGVVIWEFRGASGERTRRALRLIGASFFVLAAYVVVEAGRHLLVGSEAGESPVGIVLAAVSLLVMPALAVTKRRTGRALGSPTLLADATETLLCSYLSAILLVGLLLNASVGWWWADPLAAIGIAYLAVREGLEAWRGDEHDHDGNDHGEARSAADRG